MTGFWPIIVSAGEQEQVGNRRSEILRLNIGPAVPINVTANSFTITRSCHRISNLTATDFDINFINGGEEGDLIFLLSGLMNKKVKLKKQTGNLDILDDFEFKERNAITLYRNPTHWEEVSRHD